MRRINQAGLDLIKLFEGFRANAYLDPIGIPTIGYGFTEGVKMGQTMSKIDAELRLQRELQRFEAGVESLIKPWSITDNQFSALVCFAYNVGLGNLQSSTLLKKLKAGQDCSDQFIRWNKAGGKELPGLTKRRLAERELFLK